MLPSDVSSYLSIFLDQFLYSVFKVHILLLTVLSVMKNRKISDFSSLVKTSYINIFIKMMFFIYKSLSALFLKKSGSHLLSHAVSSVVPSAAYVLTIVFGMGTGVSHKRITTRSIEYLARFFRA